MSTAVTAVPFFTSAAVSLGSSWVVVSRIERVGYRLGASEALLGLVSALAADAPEITSSVSALGAHRGALGAGVIVGSNVLNLAALIGVGSIVAGTIALHRRVVLLEGVIALWAALGCALVVAGLVTAAVGLLLVLVVLVPYAAIAAFGHSGWWRRWARSSAWRRWLTRAMGEEELELRAVFHPRRGRPRDALVAAVFLAVVVAASVTMERSASSLGVRLGIPGIVVGALVLAAVTSLPNMVAAIYWARRGRGTAMLSTAFNSNALNVAAGLLLPAVLVGTSHRSGPETLVVVWYGCLTAAVVVLAYASRGLGRFAGWLVVAAYVAFVALLVTRS